MQSRCLWLTVIQFALTDYKRKKLDRAYFDTRDFSLVCHFADVEPNDIRKKL